MSNSIIPHLLSDSPPPIAGNIEEEYDDEFGDFTGPADLSFDNDNSSMPSTPKNSKQHFSETYPDFDLNSPSFQINSHDESVVINKKNELPPKSYINILDHIENGIPKIENLDNLQENIEIETEISSQNVEYDSRDSISNEESNIFDHCNGSENSESLNGECGNLENVEKEDIDSRSSENIASNDVKNVLESNVREFDSKDYNDNSINKLKKNSEDLDTKECSKNEEFEMLNTKEYDDFHEKSDCLSEEVVPSTDIREIDENFEFENINEYLPHSESDKTCVQPPNIDVNSKQSEGCETLDDFSESTSTNIPGTENEESNFGDFDQFADFSSFQSTSFKEESFKKSIEQECENTKSNEEDDFADFENYSSSNQQKDEDDFDDFSSYSTFSNDKTSSPTTCKSPEEAREQAKTILEVMFPSEKLDYDDFINCDVIEENAVYQNLKDITETKALSYQWEKSTARKNLLKTLNIDIRNILYGPSWNAGVPIFAANLCSTPLEPIKTDLPPQTAPLKEEQTQSEPSSISTEVPVAEFDWNSSGLINPLGSLKTTEKTSDTNKSIDEIQISPLEELDQPVSNVETIEFSAMNSNEGSEFELEKYKNDEIEDDFSDFASYQPKYEEKSDWSAKVLPLRESHISYQTSTEESKNTENSLCYNFDLDLLETKNTDIRVDQPKTSVIDFSDLEFFTSDENKCIEYERKQSKTSSENAIEEISEPPTENVGASFEPEDDFSDFHSSLPPASENPPPTILQPAVLQPISANNQTVTKIEWPEPGLDEDEVNRIVIGCLRKNSNVEPTNINDVQSIKKEENKVEDDEWSDFVSVKGSVKSRTSTPDLPLSVFNLGNIQPVKAPTPLITPNGLISSPSHTVPKPNVNSLQNAQCYTQRPFITSQAFEALHQNSMGIQPMKIAENPLNFQSSSVPKCSTDDDDWGEFVSAANVPPSLSNNYQSNTHIITNPSHNMVVSNKKPQQYSLSRNTVVRQERQNIPTISALPDLEFVNPRVRSMKK